MKTLGLVAGARREECEHCGEVVQVVTIRRIGFNRKSAGWFDRVEDHACPVRERNKRVCRSRRDLFEEDGR